MAAAVGAIATAGLLAAAIWAGKTAKRQLESAASAVRMQIDAAGENVKTQIEAATSNVTSQIDEQRQIEKRRRVHDHLRTFYSAAFTEMSADAGLVFLAARRDPSEIERALLVDLYWRKYRDSRSGSQRAPPSLISPVHIQT